MKGTSRPKSNSKKVLVVEDDLGISEVIKIILEDHYYQVIVHNHGTGVLPAIRKNRPHIILLDLWMTGMDGSEIIKKLRANKSMRNIPVVVVSALSEGEAIARKMGADDFLAKPFDINDLVKIVDKYTSA